MSLLLSVCCVVAPVRFPPCDAQGSFFLSTANVEIGILHKIEVLNEGLCNFLELLFTGSNETA